MSDTNQTTESFQVAMTDISNVTYTVRDPRPENGYAILAGPFVDVEDARKHQQLHLGSRVYREEFFP